MMNLAAVTDNRLEQRAMAGVMDGVRVLEVAAWVFVPAAGAVLADLGADVIKVEDPRTGDPYRGLVTQGIATVHHGVNYSVEQANRGKRSIGLDLKSDEGRALLYRLAATADVFLTSFRPAALARLGLDVAALREHNPSMVYVRGHGSGVRGPQANRPGYDATAFWARGGMAHTLTPPDAERPITQRPAFGDRTGAMNLAFGIAAALFRRERTGEPSVVDVSLLSSAAWVLATDVLNATVPGAASSTERPRPRNPLVNAFETSDGRWLSLVFLQPDRYWVELCEHLGRPELAADPRFVDSEARASHTDECRAALADVFEGRPYHEWCERLSGLDAPWAPVQSVRELLDDEQFRANGYLQAVEAGDGATFPLVSAPVQFDGAPAALRRAPEPGEHTEAVLRELGIGWEEIAAYKQRGVIT
jgi:crotonobetainyl-CoA:carnitine CoA-transferase CaiB-like acyl-CoA transferase